MKKIYIDVSDTIALPPEGSSVFLPHEVELGKIVANDSNIFKSNTEKNKFIVDFEAGYDQFCTKRRDNEVPVIDRYKLWLNPFTGYLKQEHIVELVKDWKVNKNFLRGIKVIDCTLNCYPDLEIVSGNLVNINRAFLISSKLNQDIEKIRPANHHFDIQGIEIHFNDAGLFTGDISSKGELYYSDYTKFPKDCVVVGDDAMKKYGFSYNFVNVQTYSEKETLKALK